MVLSDFFADMVVNVTLDATRATLGTVPAFPAFVGPDNHDVSNPTRQVSGKINAVPVGGYYTYTKYTQEFVDASGAVLTPLTAARNFVRYAEYPGQRLFRKVKFDVNGNPLDEYTAEAMMFHQKFRVQPNKLTGWKRLVGQEVPIEGYTGLQSVAGASVWPAAITDLKDVNVNAAVGAPVSAAETARRLVQVVNGPQTPKLDQPALDLWVPLT